MGTKVASNSSFGSSHHFPKSPVMLPSAPVPVRETISTEQRTAMPGEIHCDVPEVLTDTRSFPECATYSAPVIDAPCAGQVECPHKDQCSLDQDAQTLIEKLTSKFKDTQELLNKAQLKIHQVGGIRDPHHSTGA